MPFGGQKDEILNLTTSTPKGKIGTLNDKL